MTALGTLLGERELVQKAIGAGDDEVLMVIAQKLPALADVLGTAGEGPVSLIVSNLREFFIL
ncbi:unnamed protein product [Dibothriocephalus latus]|uniref:Uncharacterized protein n=1 Tax=Dibothriocephalus latus TaxID=60516 RepID=A0A3P7L6J5_DIBLA|nr:unnamed protein product [Dibothriocephalus latus]